MSVGHQAQLTTCVKLEELNYITVMYFLYQLLANSPPAILSLFFPPILQ